MQALRQQEDQLQAARLELEDHLSERKIALADDRLVRSYVEDLKELLDESPLAEQKAFIRSFVKEVKVRGKEATLTYTMPLLPDGTSYETAGVLDTVHYGGPSWTRTRDLSLIRTAL